MSHARRCQPLSGRYQHTAIVCAFLMVWTTMLQVPGCGSAGSNPLSGVLAGGTAGPTDLGQLIPGSFITLLDDAIQEGSKIEVTFKGANGYLVSVDSELTQNGSARIAVPVFVNPTTATLDTGEVTVSITGKDSTYVGTIAEPTKLTGFSPGEVLTLVLQAAIEDYQAALADLAVAAPDYAQTDTTGDQADLQAQIDSLQSILDELQATGQLVVNYEDGSQYTLTGDDLVTVDRLLAAFVAGCMGELQADTSQARTLSVRPEGANPPNPGTQFTQDMARDLHRVSDQVTAVGQVIGNGAAVVLGVAGFVMGGEIAIAAGLASVVILASTGAISSMGSYAVRTLSSAFGGNERPKFDAAGTAIGIARDVAPDLIAPHIREPYSTALSAYSLASNVKGVYDGMSTLKCARESQGGSEQSVRGIEDFCEGIDANIPSGPFLIYGYDNSDGELAWAEFDDDGNLIRFPDFSRAEITLSGSPGSPTFNCPLSGIYSVIVNDRRSLLEDIRIWEVFDWDPFAVPITYGQCPTTTPPVHTCSSSESPAEPLVAGPGHLYRVAIFSENLGGQVATLTFALK